LFFVDVNLKENIMKKLIFGLIAAVAMPAMAQVNVGRVPYGSGTPGQTGVENAVPVNDVFHVPQYLPGYPTSAVIFPRVVDVKCVKGADKGLTCEGFEWIPALGRGEYLYVNPVLVESPKVITKEVPVVVIKEVPVKPKKE